MSGPKNNPSDRKIEYLKEVLKVRGTNKKVNGNYWTEKDDIIFTAAHTARLDWLMPNPGTVSVIGDIVSVDRRRMGRIYTPHIVSGDYEADANGEKYSAKVTREGAQHQMVIKRKGETVKLQGLSGIYFSAGNHHFVITVAGEQCMYGSLTSGQMMGSLTMLSLAEQFSKRETTGTHRVELGDGDIVIQGVKGKSTTIISAFGRILPSQAHRWSRYSHSSLLSFSCDDKEEHSYKRYLRGVSTAPQRYVVIQQQFKTRVEIQKKDNSYKISYSDTTGARDGIWQDQYGIWHLGTTTQHMIPYAKYCEETETETLEPEEKTHEGRSWKMLYNTCLLYTSRCV